MHQIQDVLASSHLGKSTEYIDQYQPNLLKTIPRDIQRQSLANKSLQQMHGFDLWNAYELSWLNLKHKPEIAILQLRIPSDSPWMVESKSLKLYLNSFQQTPFESTELVKKTIAKDLSEYLETHVLAELILPSQFSQHPFCKKIHLLDQEKGYCLDQLDIDCSQNLCPEEAKKELKHQNYSDFEIGFKDDININQEVNFLETRAQQNQKNQQKNWVSETLYSNLLKSNCLVTNQPDWGSLKIEYTGYQINYESLLRYIISFRQHQEFHEHCVERIFCDLMEMLDLQHLSIFAQYTRRGGIDINPFRSNKTQEIQAFIRHPRQ
jgi:7-cyano-7-deazaguanine reductase